MAFSTGISLSQGELLAAIRRTLAHHENQKVKNLNGNEVLVVFEKDNLLLKMMVEKEQKTLADLRDFVILSPDRDTRMRALNNLLDCLGPTAPDFSALQRAAEEREVTDAETGELLEAMSNGFAGHRTRITTALDRGKIQLDDIVPDSLAYFEHFCGPNPRGILPEEYLTKILPSYRKQLLNRNLGRGLEICLLGALRDDLMPAAWTDIVTDDEMWSALGTIDLSGNPFALLGTLDIAINRQYDERFKVLADEIMTNLLQEQLLRQDGIDCYELLPIFSQLVLDRINLLEGGALCEPFWKRMCAWMHAGILMQSTLNRQINLEVLRGWVLSNRNISGTYAQMVDLRHEPMYRAGEMSRSSLREEIIGRLGMLRDRHQSTSCPIPRSAEISEAMTSLSIKGSPLGWAMPGPLDGHLRPAELKGRSLSETDVTYVLEELAKDPFVSIWSRLAYFSQYFDLGAKILLRACEVSSGPDFKIEQLEGQTQPDRLFDICLVAAAHRNTDLARAISSIALAKAPHAQSAEKALKILHILLFASAAFECEDEWSDWIAEQLADLAYRLPQGEATRTLLEHLEQIKRVLPVERSICSRAEAVASSAN
ncbi:hypothetical protein PJI16_00260 [Nitrospira sp. MA-1]|nr:hypothetical protein [Nitrospira sp. MA-1]